MQHKVSWIDEKSDGELQSAWKQLAVKKGGAAGWQYRGSEQTDAGWVHHFLNKRLRDSAETDEALDDARAVVPASDGWEPSQWQIIGGPYKTQERTKAECKKVFLAEPQNSQEQGNRSD